MRIDAFQPEEHCSFEFETLKQAEGAAWTADNGDFGCHIYNIQIDGKPFSSQELMDRELSLGN